MTKGELIAALQALDVPDDTLVVRTDDDGAIIVDVFADDLIVVRSHDEARRTVSVYNPERVESFPAIVIL